MPASETALLPMQTVEAVVMAYTDAQRDVAEAFRLFQQAQDRLKTFLEYPHVFPESWNVSIYDDTPAQAADRIRRDAWWHIYIKTGIDKLCSIKQAQAFRDQISRGEMPELTIENIERLLANLRDGLPNMLEEAVKEIFDWLRPSDRGWGPKYATNVQYKVGPRVILEYVIEPGWQARTFSVRYGYSQHLRALDNVFHLMDGAGIAKYPDDLVTAIDRAGGHGQQECGTRYFKCRWYKKGTLHIEFKRADLVDELNRRGGGEGLPGPDRQRAGQTAV